MDQRPARRLGRLRRAFGIPGHAGEGAVAVDQHVLQRARDMQRDQPRKHPPAGFVEGGEAVRQGRVLGHQRQALAQRPQDAGKPAGCGRMQQPARQRHDDHAQIQRPVHRLGQEGLGPAIGVQGTGTGLAQRPQDAAQGKDQHRDAHRLVDRECREDRLHLVLRALRQAARVKPQRDGRQDQDRDGPVEEAGDPAIGAGCVAGVHRISPIASRQWRRQSET